MTNDLLGWPVGTLKLILPVAGVLSLKRMINMWVASGTFLVLGPIFTSCNELQSPDDMRYTTVYLYYYQESNAIYLDPYNLQCLTPQG